jgi:hypothetical protein
MTNRDWLSLAFAAALAGCASTAASPTSPAAAKAKKEAPDKEGELLKKQRELDYARIGLEIARFDAENAERSDVVALEAAERELAAAKAERENFVSVARALELDERVLGLDRSRQNALESEQELAELEAMYAQEEFAGTTKELVITRGRARLAMAKRDFVLSERRLEQLRSFEHQKRERELNERVTKAEQGAADAHAKRDKGRMERKLSLLKAEHALDDAERALVKAKQAHE